MKRKILLKVLGGVGLLGMVLLFYFHSNDLRCLFISQSDQFLVSKEDNITIYVSKDTPKDTVQLLYYIIKEGINRNELLWGKKLGEATVIYCHNPTLYNKFGHEGLPALTRLGTYIIAPSTSLSEEIFSHEFCHTEMFNNLDRNLWVYFYRLPCWFDEGLALQFNNSGVYSSDSLEAIEKMSLEELRKIDRYGEFYVTDSNQLLNHYSAAKLELSRWLNKNSKEDILKVVTAFKNGKDFYEAYANPKKYRYQ